jgi:hypothetical protein
MESVRRFIGRPPALAGLHLQHVAQPAAAARSPAHTNSSLPPAAATPQQQHLQLQQPLPLQPQLLCLLPLLLLHLQLHRAALLIPACLLLLRLLLQLALEAAA